MNPNHALADIHALDPRIAPTPATEPEPRDAEPEPPDAEPDDLRLITIAAAAARLDLSRSKVYELIADGELPTVRIGRARRIALADLRAFVARHRAS